VIFAQLGASHAHSHLVTTLGGVRFYQGDLIRARRVLEQSLADSRSINCLSGIASALYFLAGLNRLRGSLVVAAQQAVECLVLQHRVSKAWWLVNSIELVGGLACQLGQPERATRLLAAAATLRQDTGVPIPPILRPAYEGDLAMARGALGSRRFGAAWRKGSVMTVDQLVEYARQTAVAGVPPRAGQAGSSDSRPELPISIAGLPNRVS
jgi:hypothetical protein